MAPSTNRLPHQGPQVLIIARTSGPTPPQPYGQAAGRTPGRPTSDIMEPISTRYSSNLQGKQGKQGKQGACVVACVPQCVCVWLRACLSVCACCVYVCVCVLCVPLHVRVSVGRSEHAPPHRTRGRVLGAARLTFAGGLRQRHP